jgi:hypothetical protein
MVIRNVGALPHPISATELFYVMNFSSRFSRKSPSQYEETDLYI